MTATPPAPLIPDADLDAVTRLCIRYELLSFNVGRPTLEQRLAAIERDPVQWKRHRREVEDMLDAVTRVGYRLVKGSAAANA